jgi:hypothetical protein
MVRERSFEQFNEQASNFLNKMIQTFPDEPRIIQFKLYLDGIMLFDNKKPVSLFVDSFDPYGVQIMSKDEKFFKKQDKVAESYIKENEPESITSSLGLVDRWDSLPPETKNSIWLYIQTLYALGLEALNRSQDLRNIMKVIRG